MLALLGIVLSACIASCLMMCVFHNSLKYFLFQLNQPYRTERDFRILFKKMQENKRSNIRSFSEYISYCTASPHSLKNYVI